MADLLTKANFTTLQWKVLCDLCSLGPKYTVPRTAEADAQTKKTSTKTLKRQASPPSASPVPTINLIKEKKRVAGADYSGSVADIAWTDLAIEHLAAAAASATATTMASASTFRDLNECMSAVTAAAAAAASEVMHNFRNTNNSQGSPHTVDGVSSCSLSSKSISSQSSKASDDNNNHVNPQSPSFQTEYFTIDKHDYYDEWWDESYDSSISNSTTTKNLAEHPKQILLQQHQAGILASLSEEDNIADQQE